MKYHYLFFILLLLLVLLFGRFLISSQKIFYGISDLVSVSPQVKFPRVKIYSTYPFNNRADVVINAGSRQGVKKLTPVTAGEDILFGQIVEVFDNSSIVRTIFTDGWRIPARVGPGEVDALLEGGATPKLTMVAKEKELLEGQSVYSAGQDFPYGLTIGKVKNIKDDPSGVFKEAEVEAPYNFNDLREVTIFLPPL